MKRWPIILLLIVATGATYWRAVTWEFTSWDDPDTIASNPRLNPASIKNVLHYWRHPAGGLYIPVTYTYWSALAGISLRPQLYHGGSVLLHIIAVLLVFAILRQIIESDAACGIGALLFALHPVQVEAVVWASGAKDVLAAVFSLVMIAELIRFAAKRQGGSGGGVDYAIALIAFALAILSKPSAVVAPLIGALLVWVRFAPPVKVLLRWIAPMLLIGIACVIWSRLAQAQFAPTDTPLWARPLIAADALAFYLWNLIWPTNLGIIYGRTPQAVMDSGVIYYAWIAPVLIGALLWKLWRRTIWAAVGGSLFVIALLPMLGFARFEFQIHSTVADRYLYLPMLGVAIAAAGLVALRPGVFALSVSGAICVLLSILTMLQIRHWRDSETLFTQAVRVNPASIVARDGLAKAYASGGRIDDAIAQFRIVVTMAPDSRLAHANLAQALLIAGRYDEAITQARRAIQLANPEEDVSREQYLLEQSLMRRTTWQPPTTTAP